MERVMEVCVCEGSGVVTLLQASGLAMMVLLIYVIHRHNQDLLADLKRLVMENKRLREVNGGLARKLHNEVQDERCKK